MAYNSALVLNSDVALAPLDAPEGVRDFRRFERLVVLFGASALGGLIGVSAAIATGRLDLWIMVAAAAPFFIVALHLTNLTLRDALRREARGCSIASVGHAAALLAWPMTALLTPLGSLNFFIAPVLAMSTLILFASCWGGSSRVVYRTCAQGALVALVAAHQGMMVVMG